MNQLDFNDYTLQYWIVLTGLGESIPLLNGIVSITEEGSSLNNTAASLNSLVASGNHIVAEIESKGIDVSQASRAVVVSTFAFSFTSRHLHASPIPSYARTQ